MLCVGWTGPLPSLLDGWHNAPLWSSIHGYAAPYHRITCTFVQTTCSSSTPAHCHELSTRHFAYKIHIHWGQSPARPHTPCTHSAKHMSWLAADQVHTQPACIIQLGPGRHSGKWQQWQATHPLRLDASLMQTADGRARGASVLAPLDGLDVDALLDHLPERAHLAQLLHVRDRQHHRAVHLGLRREPPKPKPGAPQASSEGCPFQVPPAGRRLRVPYQRAATARAVQVELAGAIRVSY